MAFELLGQSCAKIEVLGTEVCEMYVNGQLVHMCGEPPTPPEAPGSITNFAASDGRVNTIEMTFSGAGGYPAPTYDLYENGYKVANGISSGYDLGRTGPYSATYKVIATNSEGTSTSNENVGSSTAEYVYNPPSTITNFTASGGGDGGGDAQVDGIEINFSPASGAISHDLYDNDDYSYPATDVYSGQFVPLDHKDPREYKLFARNSDGNTMSNTNIGEARSAPGDIYFSWDNIGGSNPEYGSGSLADFLFTVPDGVTVLTVELWGAGGGGGGGQGGESFNDNDGGGGHGGLAGELRSNTTYGSTPGAEYIIVIGYGGEGGNGGSGGDYHAGDAGSQGSHSSFNNNNMVAGGGMGGASQDDYHDSQTGEGGIDGHGSGGTGGSGGFDGLGGNGSSGGGGGGGSGGDGDPWSDGGPGAKGGWGGGGYLRITW